MQRTINLMRPSVVTVELVVAYKNESKFNKTHTPKANTYGAGGKATALRVVLPSPTCARVFLVCSVSRPVLGQLSLIFQAYWGVLSVAQSGRDVKLTTYLI